MTQPAPSFTPSPIAPVPFGRYTLVAKLAVGGMGEVFLAQTPAVAGLRQLLVLKRIRVELAADPQFVSRFQAEARVLLHLQHGAITQVSDVGAIDGRSYIALEFVDGKDLRALLTRVQARGERVPVGLCLEIFLRVLDALAYAHRKKDDDGNALGLVHRDVSPQNVLVSYEGEVKVIDFGLAKSALSAQRTHPSMILGKLMYMAPEIAKRDQLDRRADLFAASVMLHELIGGRHELAKLSSGELMARMVNPSFSRLEPAVPGLPPGFDDALQKGLAAEPDARYRTADEMRAVFTPLASAADPTAGPEPLGKYVRGAFEAEYAAERQLLRKLRAGPASDTVRALYLDDVRDAAPTAPFARVELSPVVGAHVPPPMDSGEFIPPGAAEASEYEGSNGPAPRALSLAPPDGVSALRSEETAPAAEIPPTPAPSEAPAVSTDSAAGAALRVGALVAMSQRTEVPWAVAATSAAARAASSTSAEKATLPELPRLELDALATPAAALSAAPAPVPEQRVRAPSRSTARPRTKSAEQRVPGGRARGASAGAARPREVSGRAPSLPAPPRAPHRRALITLGIALGVAAAGVAWLAMELLRAR